ncbi:hypothetical protein [Enterococcus camelliae]|uniref:Nudix hydrolase domain-containing protein n=1 Tax=Enterococcus camelliae TaxID=453959 RepID=A0ABW5TGK8_9ENTE
MIGKKWIAGTVILTQSDGEKLFLVKQEKEKMHLVSTKGDSEKTGLASILEVLKKEVHLEITQLKLLELTNGVIAGTNVPLFVFELEEQPDVQLVLPDQYQWQTFEQMQKVIQKFEIEGMPQF